MLRKRLSWGDVMVIDRYGELFYIQEFVLKTSEHPPPWDVEDMRVDGAEIRGLFLQGQSGEVSSAAADVLRTRGRFVTTPSAPVQTQMTLRRASDSKLFRLVGEAVHAPEKAFVGLKVYAAQEVGGAEFYE